MPYDFNVTLNVSNPAGSDEDTAFCYMVLLFTSVPDENLTVGDYYNYFPTTNYGTDANVTWSYDTLELENYANGSGFAGRPGLSDIHVSVRAEYMGSRIVYQNFTLSVSAIGGLVTEQVTLDIIMYVVALVISFVIAYVGFAKGKPYITLVSSLFAFAMIMALITNPELQGYWYFVLVPMVEFLMFFSSVRS
jgi:hypothetical protein